MPDKLVHIQNIPLAAKLWAFQKERLSLKSLPVSRNDAPLAHTLIFYMYFENQTETWLNKYVGAPPISNRDLDYSHYQPSFVKGLVK
jgi:hypothetical protein